MLRKDLDDFDANGQKGDWCFTNDDEYICIQWGDDAFVGTVVLSINSNNPKSWQWDGNHEAPTLSPSILVLPDKWHGYLRNGKLELA